MRVSLPKDFARSCMRTAYPARQVIAVPPEALRSVVHVLGYNQNSKWWNVFASRHPDRLERGDTCLCFTYDDSTDELELLCAAVRCAGLKCVYKGNARHKGPEVAEVAVWYLDHPQEIVDENRLIQERHERERRRKPFEGEWK
jgi:hypothetical protein